MSHRVLIVAIALLSLSSALRAQTGPALLTKPWAEGQQVEVQGSALFEHSGRTDDAERFQLNLYDTSGRWQPLGPEDPHKLTLGYDLLYMDIRSPDALLPERLVDQSLSAGLSLGQGGGWEVLLQAGAGYAGNNPFADGDAWYAMADLILQRQLDANSSLIVFLDYNGNRTFFPDVPLPLIAYVHRVSDDLRYTVGVPYSSIWWQPIQRLALELDYTVPADVNLSATYEVVKDVSVFGAFRNRLESFHVEDQLDHRNLFFRQRTAELGVRWNLCPHAGLELAGGYAFGQRFSTGWDVRDLDKVTEVSDEPFIRAAVNIGF